MAAVNSQKYRNIDPKNVSANFRNRLKFDKIY